MTEFEHEGRTVEVEVTAHCTPQEAWEAWADPEKLAGWFVDRARGEGRAGETMTWVFERFDMEMPYRVLESVPGESIVFGPASDDVPPFVLEIVLTRDGGDTRIRLVNSGFSEDADFDEQYAGIDSGWRMALGVLVEYLEGHFGEPKRTFMALRPTEADPEEVHAFFTDPDKLARWLGAGRRVGEEGSEVALELADGGTLTGTVLARTDREVALSWREIDGTLELKSFAQGPQRMVGVRGYAWGMDEAEASALEERMEAAVERLVSAL